MATTFFTRDKDLLKENGFEVLAPLAQPDSPTGRQVTWIGYSTLLVSSGGQHILTDPIFLGGAAPFSFMGPKCANGWASLIWPPSLLAPMNRAIS